MFSAPVDAVPARLGFAPRGMFFEVSEWSMRRCLRSHVNDGRDGVTTVRNMLAMWRRTHNDGQPLEAFDDEVDCEAVRRTIGLLIPHAMLITCGRWSKWALPIASARMSAGLGLNLVAEWLRPWQALRGGNTAVGGAAGDAQHVLSPDVLLDSADVLRLALAGQPIDADQTRAIIGRLDRVRDNMMVSQARDGSSSVLH